ncbi:MAG TPA: galactose-1-phosphate uridylyltransferase [Polyangiaceae bacterium]|nr:galactose-1-phosphate uridylyltransferase [Polyangiaceae bacterium]
MSTLRFDVTTGEWVAFSSVRSKRPDGFRSRAVHATIPPNSEPSCPFCPGNEALTPPACEVEPDPRDPSRWSVRIFQNKFPVLEPVGTTTRRINGPLFREMDGYGRHEVVVESPEHSRALFQQGVEHVARLLRVLHRRAATLYRDAGLEVVQIFKNHGSSAGSSMRHPHFQIVGTPIVPRQMRIKYQTAAEYYQITGSSVYADLARAELVAQTRVIAQNPEFVAFAPYASRAPFEMWVVPLRLAPTFESADPSTLPALAELLVDVLGRLSRALDNPPFNLLLNSAPRRHADEPDFVWHIEIVPRLATAAGLELSTGMAINGVFPESAAELLRAAAPTVTG